MGLHGNRHVHSAHHRTARALTGFTDLTDFLLLFCTWQERFKVGGLNK